MTTERDSDEGLYETMILDGPRWGEVMRYAMWEAAEAGHQSVIKQLQRVAA